MNRMQLFALLLLSSSFASYTYTVDVDRSGYASVTLSMEGGDTVNVSLPSDASNFRIVGGSYKDVEGTAMVSAGQSGLATFSFSTALFTTKADSGWKLSFSPPEGASIRVYTPPYASIENAFPQPDSVSSEGSRVIIESGYAKTVTIYYRLGDVPATTEGPNLLQLAIGAIVVLAVIAIYSLGYAPRLQPKAAEISQPPAEKPPTLALTQGKLEMMETFNENDKKIVNCLMGSGGKSRRNELERKAGVSKSSLAMALNRLEKRKMIEMDRTSTTHFVKLSDYFLRL